MATGAHCELFPACMEMGENATIPACHKPKCPGRAKRDFALAFARGLGLPPEPQTEEDDTIANMRAFLWAAGINAGDAEFAAKQLYWQGLRIVKSGDGDRR